MNKYIFQEGGSQYESFDFSGNPHDDSQSSTSFFNSLVNNLYYNQPNSSSNYNSQNVKEEEDDYINNLQESQNEEQLVTDFGEPYIKNIIDAYFDEKLSLLDQRFQEYSALSSMDGQNMLASLFDVNDENTPNYFDNPFMPQRHTSNSAANNVGFLRDADTGEFRSFETPEQGRAALINQLQLYATGRTSRNVNPSSTLYEAMAVYAPWNDNNNPKEYAEFIANRLGISSNTPISQIDLEKWADAITIKEGNKNVNYSVTPNYKTAYTATGALNFKSSGRSGLNNIGAQGVQIGNEVAALLGYKPTYNSVFRTKAHQEELIRQGKPAAKNSRHLTGNAIDIKPEDWNNLSEQNKQYIKNKYKVIYHDNHYHVQYK